MLHYRYVPNDPNPKLMGKAGSGSVWYRYIGNKYRTDPQP
jgi:hypothetical protein